MPCRTFTAWSWASAQGGRAATSAACGVLASPSGVAIVPAVRQCFVVAAVRGAKRASIASHVALSTTSTFNCVASLAFDRNVVLCHRYDILTSATRLPFYFTKFVSVPSPFALGPAHCALPPGRPSDFGLRRTVTAQPFAPKVVDDVIAIWSSQIQKTGTMR